MIITKNNELDFLISSLTINNEFQDFDSFNTWFGNKKQEDCFSVEEIPFESLENWYFESGTRNLRHSTGKFFSVEGLNINTNFGLKQKWEQPIIIQPEIGILGILTKVFNGVRYFLMQAKMEPGNINIIQLSPTVQATKSNYTKVHKGTLPKYLEYFIDSTKSKIIIDQLQTEQGGRFLRKRNRNMVIEINESLVPDKDFIWMTLGQIKMALRIDNLVNMDSRSVLATIPILDEDFAFSLRSTSEYLSMIDALENSNEFTKEIINSLVIDSNTFQTYNEVISWITSMKTRYELNVTRIPLCNVVDWYFTDYAIKHESKPFFSVIAVKVQAANREVIQWTQPMLKEENIGLLGYVVKTINGILHFLVQAKVEPGSIDIVDIAPTVSCSNYREVLRSRERPPFIELFESPKPESILFSAIQSEEGGRFFHFQNLNIIIRADHDQLKEIPENYTWLTLGQMMRLNKFGLLNVESRSLISALSLH